MPRHSGRVIDGNAQEPGQLVPRLRRRERVVAPVPAAPPRLPHTHRLDLVPYLEPDWRLEAAHAVLHLGLAGALRRLGRRVA
jgi:hypothetical protein